MIGSFILESFTPAKVTCSICGETSHLARDCPLRHDRKKVEESRKRDQAYLEFMSELDGEPMPRKREKKEAISGKVEESDDMQVDEPSNGPAVAVQPVGGMVPVMMPGVIAYAPVGAMGAMGAMSSVPSMPSMSSVPSMPSMSSMPSIPSTQPTPMQMTWEQQQTLMRNMRRSERMNGL